INAEGGELALGAEGGEQEAPPGVGRKGTWFAAEGDRIHARQLAVAGAHLMNDDLLFRGQGHIHHRVRAQSRSKQTQRQQRAKSFHDMPASWEAYSLLSGILSWNSVGSQSLASLSFV